MYCVFDNNFEGSFRMQPHISAWGISTDQAIIKQIVRWVKKDGTNAITRPFEFYWSDEAIYNNSDVAEDFPERVIWNYLAAHDAVGMRTYFIDID